MLNHLAQLMFFNVLTLYTGICLLAETIRNRFTSPALWKL